MRDIDSSSRDAFAYETVVGDQDAFGVIGREAPAAGAGRSGVIGSSTSYLFNASTLVTFATSWLRKHFR